MNATYCPEDNKLRLYVGRVPRDEYEKLRAEGWVSTPKQSAAGQGEFAATWTPDRHATAVSYADDGIIDDEDAGPAERAADRAERFGDYRDKRTDEAIGQADRFDAGPQAHGFQSQARAERSASRHDRIAGRAVDAWSKAEYWTRRTAGVISSALYKSTPAVRMGRIKTLEAEQRKHAASMEEYAKLYRCFEKLAAVADPVEQTALVRQFLGCRNVWADYMHPRAEAQANEYRRTNKLSLYSLTDGDDPITGAEACALFFSNHSAPVESDAWSQHYAMRLLYENQMLEAQGGRAAFVEMIAGGWLGTRRVLKVNKSPVTGRVTSAEVMGTHTGYTKESGYRQQETRPCPVLIETERLPADAYRAPTDEELAQFQAERKAAKAAKPKAITIPLINPTDEDAERLQALWNERERARVYARNLVYGADKAERYTAESFKPAQVKRIAQAVYSTNSGGNYSACETRELCHDGKIMPRFSNMWSADAEKRNKERGPAVCKIRITNDSVIILTDKPQKPLPASVWTTYTPAPVVVREELVLA